MIKCAWDASYNLIVVYFISPSSEYYHIVLSDDKDDARVKSYLGHAHTRLGRTVVKAPSYSENETVKFELHFLPTEKPEEFEYRVNQFSDEDDLTVIKFDSSIKYRPDQKIFKDQ